MAGVKGRSGPQGEKPWRQALMLALNRPDGKQPDRKQLAAIAEETVTRALAGEAWAIKEIGERVDGKAVQAIEHSGDVTVRHEDWIDRINARVASEAGHGPEAVRGCVPEYQDQGGDDKPPTLQ